MVLFGAPIAHEDHARRAVLAALDVQQALREAGKGVFSSLQVRMGLNTGLVVVGVIGDNLRMDYTAVGDTTNLAARKVIDGVRAHLNHPGLRGSLESSSPIQQVYDLSESR